MKLIKFNKYGVKKKSDQAVPVGTIIAFAGTTIPGGWLACNGAAVTSTYPALRAMLVGASNPYGTSGSDPKLPDLQGRVPIGAGTGTGLTARATGSTVGSTTVTLTSSESGLQNHNHAVNQDNHTHSVSDSHKHNAGLSGLSVNNDTNNWYMPSGGAAPSIFGTSGSNVGLGWSNSSSTSGIGINDYAAENAASSHSNVQPCLVVSYMIKAL